MSENRVGLTKQNCTAQEQIEYDLLFVRKLYDTDADLLLWQWKRDIKVFCFSFRLLSIKFSLRPTNGLGVGHNVYSNKCFPC